MSIEEITKEIIVSMIEKGFFDSSDTRDSYESMRSEKIDSIRSAFKAIAKTVNECRNGEFE